MHPTHQRVIQFCMKMEGKLDERLFQTEDDDKKSTVAGKVAKGAVAGGGAVYGASVLKRGLSPLVADRRAGMRAMIPGFTQKSPLGQSLAATGTVLRDKPGAVLRSIGGTVAGDAAKVGSVLGRPISAVGRMAADVGKTVASETVKTARAVPGALGMMGRDIGRGVARVATPVLSRLKGLAGKLLPKG